ncbi:MAG: hypothetical protein R3Y49_04350 [Rikenellaceae bacterium]
MKNLVSSYIEEELLGLRIVELPWVGLLYVERQSATIDHGAGLITSPYDTLELSGEDVIEQNFFEDFSAYIKRSTVVGNYLGEEQFYERAVAEYDAWWQESRTDSGELFIEGVCTINTDQRRITAFDGSFLEMLLPYSEPVELPVVVAINNAVLPPVSYTPPTQTHSRKTTSVRVAHIPSFAVVLSIIVFVASVLYIGYIVFQCHYPLK